MDTIGAVPSNAVAVGPGTINSAIDALGDMDLFKVTLAKGYTYRVDISGVNAKTSLFNANQAPLQPNFSPNYAATYKVIVATSELPYFVLVEGGMGAYTLNILEVSTLYPDLKSIGLNLLRPGSEADISFLVGSSVRGWFHPKDFLSQAIEWAGDRLAVATLNYQFFTGKIPSEAGVDYLVSPLGGNANHLNSDYYFGFNPTNRYINFAVNLGRDGEGRASFEAKYGSLSLFEATRNAYSEIFGSPPSDAKVSALLADGRENYFKAYGGDALGTKAAMVGWLLAEGERSDTGSYAKSNDAFLTDLADGAEFSVDLIGVYGRPEFAYLG